MNQINLKGKLVKRVRQKPSESKPQVKNIDLLLVLQ